MHVKKLWEGSKPLFHFKTVYLITMIPAHKVVIQSATRTVQLRNTRISTDHVFFFFFFFFFPGEI